MSVHILMNQYYRDRIASKMLDTSCEALRGEAARLDQQTLIVSCASVEEALEGKSPAEQITMIAAIGGMFGWEDVSLEKDVELKDLL